MTYCGHFGRGQKDKHDYVNGGVTRGGSGVFTGGGVAVMAVTGECDVMTGASVEWPPWRYQRGERGP